MPFGLIVSFLCHGALLLWAYASMRAIEQLPTEDTPAISAEIITPSEFLRLKQGSEDAKNLETKANDKPTLDDSKNDTKKPDNTPPPPAAEPPPPVEEAIKPPEPFEPPPPAPEPPAEPKVAEPPPAPTPPPEPEPAPGPTPDEQKLLEQKIEDERKAEEAKKLAAEEAKKKAEEEAKKKKLAEEAKKKKAAEEAKKKAEAAKKKFDANKLAELLNKVPDDQTKALIDKDPTKKGQQAQGSSQTATALGKEAGTATGTDTVLSAREQDLLKGLIKSQLAACWRLPGAGGGTETPVVTLRWRLKTDGTLDGDPSVQSAPSDSAGQVAAEAALRAVKGCQPFRLPEDKYDGWKDVIWVFDPRQML
ncbi:MAG: cell envelope integrity protein TolA [Hyphomicrobium sp.]